jgi:hypothetical protein
MATKKKNKARQYKPSTIRRLDTLSGNECSSPDCDKPLIARDDKSIISKICHIEAASSDGPRYNPSMTDDERRDFSNLILLCDECHTIIDNKENENEYPVSLLKDWKDIHQSKIIQNLQTKQSLLKMAIDAIADYDLDDSFDNLTESRSPFNIDHKIQYNMVVRNRPLINEYKVYYNKLSTLYDELETQGSFKKDKLLNNIRRIYLKVKGKYVDKAENEIEAVRDNADNIIEDIEDILNCFDGVDQGQFLEDISFGISVVMVDAFMRCKILEEPEMV